MIQQCRRSRSQFHPDTFLIDQNILNGGQPGLILSAQSFRRSTYGVYGKTVERPIYVNLDETISFPVSFRPQQDSREFGGIGSWANRSSKLCNGQFPSLVPRCTITLWEGLAGPTVVVFHEVKAILFEKRGSVSDCGFLKPCCERSIGDQTFTVYGQRSRADIFVIRTEEDTVHC